MVKASNIYVRELTSDDLPYTQSIVSMVNSAYVGEGGWTSIKSYVSANGVEAEDIIERIQKCNKKSYIFLGAFKESSRDVNVGSNILATRKNPKIVGVLHIERKEDNNGGEPYASATLMSVDPIYQSQGVAYMLYFEGLKSAKQLGITYVLGYVWETRKELLDWYKKLGFQETGQIIPDYSYSPSILKKHINCIVLRKDLQECLTSKI